MKNREPEIYGQRNTPEDPTRCITAVYAGTFLSFVHQCSRKRGYGPNGLYCKQHNPKRLKAKQEEKHKKWKKEIEGEQHRFNREQEMLKLCEGIPTDKLCKHSVVRKNII